MAPDLSPLHLRKSVFQPWQFAGWLVLLTAACANRNTPAPSPPSDSDSSAPAAVSAAPTATTAEERQRNYDHCVEDCGAVQAKHPEESPVDCDRMCQKFLTR